MKKRGDGVSRKQQFARHGSSVGRKLAKIRLAKDTVLGRISPTLHRYSFLLLTSAVGLDLLATRLGYPYVGKALSSIMVMVYLLDVISLRKAVVSFWSAVMDIFFKEISVGGEHKLEPLKDGRAVIFAVAPHVNQFVDPLLVMKAVAEHSGRHVSWMAAQKSCNRPVVGAIIRALKGIPVARPDDMERRGKGFITAVGTSVYGHAGTSFTRDFTKGAVLVVKTEQGKKKAKVAYVKDDYTMELASPLAGVPIKASKSDNIKFERVLPPWVVVLILAIVAAPLFCLLPPMLPARIWPVSCMIAFFLACVITNGIYSLARDGLSGKELFGGVSSKYQPPAEAPRNPMPRVDSDQGILGELVEKTEYSLQPFVDQTDMFENVFEHLLQGGTIGIFPEGGTHDGFDSLTAPGTQLLPLRWGISVMLLGAMAKQEGLERPMQISVVPVGLNYFSPHKFRSTVSIDFGDPIEVHQDLAMQWKHGTKEEKQMANAAVMELVMAGVNSCTLQATDFNTLEVFRTIRRIYAPSGMRLSVADNVALTSGFASGFEKVQADPKVQDVMQRCYTYNSMLMSYGVRDHHVQRFQHHAFSARDRMSLIYKTIFKLVLLLFFGMLIVPWMLCAAPVGLFLSVASDHKAKEVQKMSVKATWKILYGIPTLLVLHVACTAVMAYTFGEIVSLVWVLFAPIGAIFAIRTFEDGLKLIKSLNAILLLVWQSDIGKQMYETREQLKKDIRAIKESNNWLGRLDPETRTRLGKSQSFKGQNSSFTSDSTSDSARSCDEYEKVGEDSNTGKGQVATEAADSAG